MQQNDALFQIELLNVSVYLVSVCSVAEQTLHRVASCERLHRPGPSESCIDEIELFFKKRNYTFWCSLHTSCFPHAVGRTVALALSEKSQRQLLKVGHLSRWVCWLVRFGCGGAEGWWLQQILPVLLEHDVCDWEHSWVGSSLVYSAKCHLTKFLASLEEVSDANPS